MTKDTTPTSGAADLPEALRSIQRFEVVDCIDDKHVPAVIPKPHGPWVRYEDHIAALAAGQATAAQPGVVYAELPVPNYPKSGGFPGTFAEAQMRAFADATHALRASHGQAPSGATEEVENLRKALVYAAFALHDTPQYMLAQGITLIDGDTVRVSRDGWTVEASVNPHRQPAPATQPAQAAEPANADRVQEDAALWHWLAEYLVGTRTDLDDEIVASETVNDLRKLVKAAIKQGEKQ